MDVSTKIVGEISPKSSIFNQGYVFHSFHHPFWGENPLFLETPIWEGETKHTVDGNQKSGKLTS